MSNRSLPVFSFLLALPLLSLGCDRAPESKDHAAASASVSAPTTPVPTLSAAMPPVPSALVSPTVNRDAAAAAADACTAKVGTTSIKVVLDLDTMKWPVTASGGETRHLLTKAAPHAATYSLVFDGYGPGDQKPAAEKLVAGKSVVARLVGDGADQKLYFDGDWHPAGTTAAKPVGCVK